MELLTQGGLSGDKLINVLGNTLMHSLWQGVLLAIAGGLIIVFTKKASAALRYNLLIGAMLLFTCGIVFTFILQLQPLLNNIVTDHNGNAPVSLHMVQVQPTVANYAVEQTLGNKLTAYFNAHCNTIVLVWFLIICAKGIKLAVGGYEVYHLKHTQVYSMSKYWDNRIAQLSDQLKIKQAIRLLESGIAKVPMVIGHLKPVILIPIGFINALPPAGVEAILVHELAHIGRRDYLVNLLQSFMEIVFFFNPAVIWISQLIRAERENCCDDIAVTHAGNKANYIQALLSCQEYQLAAPRLGVALANNKGNLLNRVKRIINNHNQSLNIMEKTLLTICMVTAGLFTVAFSAGDAVKISANNHNPIKLHTVAAPPKVAAAFKATHQRVQQARDTTTKISHKIYRPQDFEDGSTISVVESRNRKAQSEYLFKRNGTLYQVYLEHNIVSLLYVNGKVAAADKYRAQIDSFLEEYRQIAKPVKPLAPMQPIGAIRPPRVAMPPMAAIPAPPAEPAEPASPPAPAVAAIAPSAARPAAPPAPAIPAIATASARPVIPPVPALAPMAPLGMVGSDRLYDEITSELMKDGIIKDKNNFDINITNNAVEVDGVKQPEAVAHAILKKFVKKPGDKVAWHYSNHN